jgi:hypothetical protein
MARGPLTSTAWRRLAAAWVLLAAAAAWFLLDTLAAVRTCQPELFACVAPNLGLLLGGAWLVPAVLGGGVLLAAAALRPGSLGPATRRRLGRGAGLAGAACALVAAGGLVAAVVSTVADDPGPLLVAVPVTLVSSTMLLAPWLALAYLLVTVRKRLESPGGPVPRPGWRLGDDQLDGRVPPDEV